MPALYFAPMEGFTDAVYRQAHHRLFPGMRKYFMPFISPSASRSFTQREMQELSPARNAGVPAVPQVLCREAAYFLDTARMLRDLGYTEINLNLGCPSGTVTAKGKGAGALRDPDALARFLDAVFAAAPLPLSVKSRIGMDSEKEWPRIRAILTRYPFTEWILHPRTGREQYRGAPRLICFREAAAEAPFPVIYNGDLFAASDAWEFLLADPGAAGLMLGRGVMANPALGRELAGGGGLTMEETIRFHDALLRGYLAVWPASAAVGRMHALMGYLSQALDHPPALLRALKRAAGLDAYTDAAAAFFASATVKRLPRFVPPA